MLTYRAALSAAAAALMLVLLGAISLQASRADRTLAPSLDLAAPMALDASQQGDAPSRLRSSIRAGTQVSVPRLDGRWVRRTAAEAGIPEPAVRAYGRATLRVPQACGLGWTTLAGIGWVESEHGTIGGRSVAADGRSSTTILGPALDGAGDVAAIPATRDSAGWHGDPLWDHAIGPMQFIPSTWADWASDGDGDGIEDPHDVDDAAYAAARYLCADGLDLTTGTGWASAVWSYNHSVEYLETVMHAATVYAHRTS